MIRRPPRSTLDRSSAASDVYKRQLRVVPGIDFAFARYVDRVRRGLVNFRHERTIRPVRNGSCRYYGNLLQRRQFGESGGIGAQLRDADIFYVLKQTRLM